MENYDSIPEALIQKMRYMAGCNVCEIPGFPLYAVSADGQMFSVIPYANTTELLDPPRLLKPRVSRGYLQYQLYDEAGQRRFLGITRILALAFRGLPPDDTYEAGLVEPGVVHADNVIWRKKQVRVQQWIKLTKSRYPTSNKRRVIYKLEFSPYTNPAAVGYKGSYSINEQCVGFHTLDDRFISLASCNGVQPESS